MPFPLRFPTFQVPDAEVVVVIAALLIQNALSLVSQGHFCCFDFHWNTHSCVGWCFAFGVVFSLSGFATDIAHLFNHETQEFTSTIKQEKDHSYVHKIKARDKKDRRKKTDLRKRGKKENQNKNRKKT